jgi:2-dehydropantoate 2-reductase
VSALGDERVLVVGAGSLGTVYGAALARAGANVQLLARESHARAIQERGTVLVDSFGERWEVPLRAEWRPERIEPVEVVLLLTKTQDTETALDSLPQVRDTVRLAVSFQNGVQKNDELAAWSGPETVAGAVSMVGATLAEPGHTRHTLKGPSFIGELDGSSSERIARLAALLEAGGLPPVVTDRISSVEWSKLVHANPTTALPALTGFYLHEVFTSPELARIYVEMVREGAALAAAAGVELEDWAALFPVRTVVTAPFEEAVDVALAWGARLVEAGMTEVTVSMLQSVQTRRRLEVEALQGYLVREGERLGAPTPVTGLCYRILAGMDATYRDG